MCDFGVNISWEAGIWGRFRRQIESATAALDASLASYDGALVSLTAQLAQNYLSIRTTQARLDVARYNIRLQQTNLEIAQAKLDAGANSALDVVVAFLQSSMQLDEIRAAATRHNTSRTFRYCNTKTAW